MEIKIQSWKLTEFNLDGEIKLDNKLGLIKIYRSEDKSLILTTDWDFGLLDPEKPTVMRFSKSDSILGFILDIGIQREKILTYGHGIYAGTEIMQSQSNRKVSQENYNPELLEKISNYIDTNFQSKDKNQIIKAIKIQLLFDSYNNARLLFPNFHSESYLCLMQIIEATGKIWGGTEFALYCSQISKDLNKKIYSKLNTSYTDRVKIAEEIFNECLKKPNLGSTTKSDMLLLSPEDKVIFGCFYSAYKYRNKFAHIGFPFPDVVKDAWGVEEDAGTAYLSPSLGIMWSKIHRPEGMEDEDIIDIHEVVEENEIEDFKEKYFKLIPTWYFLKSLCREALINQIK